MQFFLTAVLFIFFSAVSFSYAEVPQGFREYKVRKGDTFSKIALREHWDLIERINRIDAQHLIIGKIIIIPSDFEKAKTFLPVPKEIPDTSADHSLMVFLEIQYFGAYERGKLKFWGPISSGNEKNPTPQGNYEMLWKSKNYISKKYDVPMPYAVNFSPEGYFIHQQSLPGQPTSHGCIRLRRSDAKLIFRWLKKGDPIIISGKGTKRALFFYQKYI